MNVILLYYLIKLLEAIGIDKPKIKIPTPKILKRKPKSIIGAVPTQKDVNNEIKKQNNPNIDNLLKTYHVTDIPKDIS